MKAHDKDWPRYFDAKSKTWKRAGTPGSARDREDPCALCGWGRHMAIHSKPDGEPPAGILGLHGWVQRSAA